MPQMAPLNWLFLYLMFSFIFILFNFMNYYIFLIKKENKKFFKLYKIMDWKW